MIVLTIRTDRPEAGIGIFKDGVLLANDIWQAHRELAETLHLKISKLLEMHNLNWQKIGGIIVYQGPGSFTGLRIGISTANALAYGLGVPIVGSMGERWVEEGLEKINKNIQTPVLPVYGSEPHTTVPVR